jgi:hypothetical protein
MMHARVRDGSAERTRAETLQPGLRNLSARQFSPRGEVLSYRNDCGEMTTFSPQ